LVVGPEGSATEVVTLS